MRHVSFQYEDYCLRAYDAVCCVDRWALTFGRQCFSKRLAATIHTTRRHISENSLLSYRPTNVSCHDCHIIADAVFLIQRDARVMGTDCTCGLLYSCVAPYMEVLGDHDARVVNDL